ncbi:hypothetical protein [Nocardia terpenica]|uniref:Uncharacterized protein n=1 Tax=Nocardia terpenica TaxID=455432 RepID=A0A6G9Z1I7_9NOCA|nr:hypothetical protein [Nocardia terpenica]QIS19378.1 hypothetical protein F6W96_14885 [Nocardia terpenica]
MSVRAKVADTVPEVESVGQIASPVTEIGTDALLVDTVEGLPLVNVPAAEAGPFGATTVVHDAIPVPVIVMPPCGMVRLPAIGDPFCTDTAQVPEVLTLMFNPGRLDVQPLIVGAAICTDTGPLGFELPGAAGTAPLVVTVVQVTETGPAVAVIGP